MNTFFVLFSFVGCGILRVRNEMTLRITSVLGNFEYANCASKDVKKSISCSEVRIFAEI